MPEYTSSNQSQKESGKKSEKLLAAINRNQQFLKRD